MNIAPPREVIRTGHIENRYSIEGADPHGALAVFAASITCSFTPRPFYTTILP